MYKFTHDGERSLSTAVPLAARYIFTEEFSAVCQKNSIRRINQVTNEGLNSPRLLRPQTGHQVSTSLSLRPPRLLIVS